MMGGALQPPLTCSPVPALVPVDLAGDSILAILPPLLTVLLAQWHIPDPLLPPAGVCLQGPQFPPVSPSSPQGSWWVGEGRVCTYLVDPRPQVRGTLIETRVLDEVALALLWHGPTVVPVEVVQVGLVLVSFQTGVGSAAGIVLPEDTLHRGSRGSAGTHQDPPGLSWDLLQVQGKHQRPWVGGTG